MMFVSFKPLSALLTFRIPKGSRPLLDDENWYFKLPACLNLHRVLSIIIMLLTLSELWQLTSPELKLFDVMALLR